MRTVRIPLSQGKFALISPEDESLVRQYRWHAYQRFGIWYAIAHIRIDGRRTSIDMHRLILRPDPGFHVDHVNGDGLDNRRPNIRPCTASQNQQNRHRLSRNTSGYRGVFWNKASRKWQAGIKHNGKSVHLGMFATAEAAARAYDQKARELFGSFARPNFEEAA